MSSINSVITAGNAAALGRMIELGADQRAMFNAPAQRDLPPPLTLPEPEPMPGTVRVIDRFTTPVDCKTGAPLPVERLRVQVPIEGGGSFTYNTEPSSAELRLPVVKTEQFTIGVFGTATPNTVGVGAFGELMFDPSFALSWQYGETWALAGSDPTRTLTVGTPIKVGNVAVTPSARVVDVPGKGIDRTEYGVTASVPLDADTTLTVTGAHINRHGAPDGFGTQVAVSKDNAEVQFRIDHYNTVAGRDETVFQIRGGVKF